MKIRARFLLFICLTITTIFTLLLLVQNETQKKFRPLFESRSIMYSPDCTKLGQIQNTFAILHTFEREQKIVGYLTARQAQILYYYFKIEYLQPYLKILEIHHPKFESYPWMNPFKKLVKITVSSKKNHNSKFITA